jgi:hypothetical protein
MWKIVKTLLSLGLLLACFLIAPSALAEFRSAKDMQKECRVALKVMDGSAERSLENTLLAGECVGYIQGAVDASQALAENTTWYKVCTPDNISTAELINKFIAFVDANPKYTLASTALQMMLAQEYKCKKLRMPVGFNARWVIGADNVDRLQFFWKLNGKLILSAARCVASAEFVELPGLHQVNKAYLSFYGCRFCRTHVAARNVSFAQGNNFFMAFVGSAVFQHAPNKLCLASKLSERS